MFKRIMAAVDDRSIRSKVLQTTLNLAQVSSASILLCHAIDESLFAQREAHLMLTEPIDDIKAHLRDSAERFLAEAATEAHSQGFPVETQVVDSEAKSIAEMLMDVAHDWKADLLIVGTHDRPLISRLFVESLAESLLASNTVSLLTVHSP